MLSRTRSTPPDSPAPGSVPEARPEDSPVAGDQDVALATHPAATARETRREHFRRRAHRSRLHGYAIVTVALVAFLIALAASNTDQVYASWVFGSSRVSLVWLVLFAALLGWLLGLVASARFHWRTRAPRRRGSGS